MSIGINTNVNSVNWESILSSIGDVTKTTGAEGKEMFTITMKSGDTSKTCTIPIPNDLDVPANVDSAAMDTVVAKLQSAGLDLTDGEVKTMKDAIALGYSSAAQSLSSVSKSSKGNVMFDLYKLMALLIEVAQQQRDAAREMRKTENELMQKSIQDQADQQRSAAMIGLVVGVTCGAISAGLSLGMMAGQSKAFSQQQKIAGVSSVDAATTKVDMLKLSDTVEHAAKQLADVSASVGDVVADRVSGSFEQQMLNGNAGNLEAKLTEAKAGVETAKLEFSSKTQQLEAVKAVHAEKVGEQNVAQQEYDAKAQEVGLADKQAKYDNAVAKKDANEKLFGEKGAQDLIDKAKVDLDQAKVQLEPAKVKLDNAKQAVTDAKGNVDVAQRDVTLAGEKVENAEANLVKVKGDFVKTLDGVADDYAEKYNAALQRRANPPEGVDKATLDADVKNAKAEMEMARALEADALARHADLSPSEHRDIIGGARREADVATQRLGENKDYKAAINRMQLLAGLSGLVQAIGGTLQSMTQNLSAVEQAEATREAAMQKQQEEQLSQTKDLFEQDQKLIDAVRQLLQAIVQAESQSMRDAIQA